MQYLLVVFDLQFCTYAIFVVVNLYSFECGTVEAGGGRACHTKIRDWDDQDEQKDDHNEDICEDHVDDNDNGGLTAVALHGLELLGEVDDHVVVVEEGREGAVHDLGGERQYVEDDHDVYTIYEENNNMLKMFKMATSSTWRTSICGNFLLLMMLTT